MSDTPTLPVVEDPSAFRLIATLGIAGFLAGVAIVGIFEATKQRIADNKARELRDAVLEVLPGSSRMEELALSGLDSPVYQGFTDSEQLVGYAIAAEGAGFQDTIKLLYGFDPAKKVIIGMYVLESRETPGLGDKIYKDPYFVANFSALAVEPAIELIKKGEPRAEHQVEAITGATISSKAVVNILNAGNAATLSALPGGS